MDSGVGALEEHFVVRFPVPLARRIRSEWLVRKKSADAAPNNNNNSNNNSNSAAEGTLEMSFSDQRHATVTLSTVSGGHAMTFPAVLVDLPTICETLRTTDASQYVKVCDLSRMLLVLEPADYERFDSLLRQCDYQWPNGLSPPMVGVGRLRRVLKTARLEQAEQEAQRLLDLDASAQKVAFAVWQGDRIVQRGGDGADNDETLTQSSAQLDLTEEEDIDEVADDYIDDEDLLGEGFAAELEDSLAQPSGDDEDASIAMELEQKRAQAASMSNPLLRQRLQGVIAELEREQQLLKKK